MWTPTQRCLVFFIVSECIWNLLCHLPIPGTHSKYEEGEDEGGLPDVITIGGLFDDEDPTKEAAFKHAVERVNSETAVMPSSRLVTQIETLTFGNSYDAANKVCDMMKGGIAAIFGPQSPEAASHVQSICDAFEIPHIETKWDYNVRKENYLINLYPHPLTLSRAYNDLVEAFGWTEYVIIYENNESLYLLQDLLKASEPPDRKALVRQLPVGDDYRGLLQEILYTTTIFNIIVECSAEKVMTVFKQAQQVGLMNHKYSFIMTTLDLHTLDLEDFRYGNMNITAFRIVDPERPEVDAIVKEWNSLIAVKNVDNPYSRSTLNSGNYHGHLMPNLRRNKRKKPNLPYEDYDEDAEENPELPPESEQKMMTTETALIYDAMFLFGKALHALDGSQKIEVNGLDCESMESWEHGYSIINYMKMVQMQGLTGVLHFNTSGYRTDVQMDVIQLRSDGLHKIGIWDSKFVTKFNWSKPEQVEEAAIHDSMIGIGDRHFTVTTIKNDPFIMLKKSTNELSGNDQFEGFTVDLLRHLSQRLDNFKYTIKLVSDNKYGSLLDRAKNKWNGMVREVIEGDADIAVADLSVNKDRQRALDFTMPFMNLGISILFVEPSKKAPGLFSFMDPFAFEVWMYVLYALLGFSLLLFMIARLSPIEWDCPHECIDDPDELENQFTLVNSFWFTMGALLCQGSDLAPKYVHFQYDRATSTRIMAGIWWFFTLIMVSSYTANLAAFLVVQDLDEPIKNLDDLANQDVIRYGCLPSGSTAAFFKQSPFEDRKAMWRKMEEWEQQYPGNLPSGNAEGVNKVLEDPGKFAFFMESTVIEYQVERRCGLHQVGGLLDNKGYGIGMRKSSPYRADLNGGVLRLQEDGTLDKLKRKWWKEERKGEGCPEEESSSALGIAHTGGVFVVLGAGLFVALIIAIFEFVLEKRKVAMEGGGSTIEEMKKEILFVLACSGNTKPFKVAKTEKKDSLSSKGSEPDNENPKDSSNEYLGFELDPYELPNSPSPVDEMIQYDESDMHVIK